MFISKKTIGRFEFFWRQKKRIHEGEDSKNTGQKSDAIVQVVKSEKSVVGSYGPPPPTPNI